MTTRRAAPVLTLVLAACAGPPAERPAEQQPGAAVTPSGGPARTGRRTPAGAPAPAGGTASAPAGGAPAARPGTRAGVEGALDDAARTLAGRAASLVWPADLERDADGRPRVRVARIVNLSPRHVDTRALSAAAAGALRGALAPVAAWEVDEGSDEADDLPLAGLLLRGHVQQDIVGGPGGRTTTSGATLRLIDLRRGVVLAQARGLTRSIEGEAPHGTADDVRAIVDQAGRDLARKVGARAAEGWPVAALAGRPRPVVRTDRARNDTRELLDLTWVEDALAQHLLDQGAVDVAVGRDEREAVFDEAMRLADAAPLEATLLLMASLDQVDGGALALVVRLIDTRGAGAVVTVRVVQRKAN